MAQKTRAIIINHKDNVATALEPLKPDTTVTVDRNGRTERLRVLSAVPGGHKIALCDIKAGEYVIKYGEPIGLAIRGISAGDHVHVHTMKSHGTNVEAGQS